ncbi:MAG TPA: hypothetical protein VGR29_00930 [Thermomicrobiales bacterium]|nr:hypothetical protein [Thermomicrobiales bacterium]
MTEEPLYRSPQFGYAVTWTSPWGTIGSDGTGTALPESDVDGLTVVMQGTELAEVRIIGADRRDLLSATETGRFWVSAAYLSEFTESGTRVVLSECCAKTAAVVMVSPGEMVGTAVVTVKESYDLGPRVSIRSTFTADLAIFHEAFGSLQQSVLIDGRAPLRCFDADVLLTVLT